MGDDATPEADEQLERAYDLIDELWPKVQERWPDDPVGRLRHVIEANLEHPGPKPSPRPTPPEGRREVTPRFKGTKK
jgi:hypothetical protein